MYPTRKGLAALILMVGLPELAHASSIQCDFNSDVGLEYKINGEEARPPKSLYGNYNASFVQAFVIKGGTILQVKHIGGAKPSKTLRIQMNGAETAEFKFPKLKTKTEATVSIHDVGKYYFLSMNFVMGEEKHTAIWKCK